MKIPKKLYLVFDEFAQSPEMCCSMFKTKKQAEKYTKETLEECYVQGPYAYVLEKEKKK